MKTLAFTPTSQTRLSPKSAMASPSHRQGAVVIEEPFYISSPTSITDLLENILEYIESREIFVFNPERSFFRSIIHEGGQKKVKIIVNYDGVVFENYTELKEWSERVDASISAYLASVGVKHKLTL